MRLVFRAGRHLDSRNLTFKFVRSGTGNGRRVSVLVPKGVAKLAVRRNLLRRRGYTALGRYFDRLPVGVLGVFIFKRYQDDILILENEIKNILAKID